MSDSTDLLPRISDDGWDEVIDRLQDQQATQLCVFDEQYHVAMYLEQQGYDPTANVFVGKFPTRFIAKLPSSVTRLCLYAQGQEETGALAIAEGLTQLTNLSISNNSIGETSAQAIAQGLTQLTNLDISSNSIGDPGAQAIAQGLTQLTNLNINSNSIGDPGAQAIAQGLTQLTNLDIGNNSIGETGAQAIAQGLTQLTSLYIGGNRIGETGAQAIAQGLTQLTNLNIYSNSIGDTGAQAIAQGLTQLTNLNINNNGIEETGAQAIAQGLTQLTNLSIRNNSIGETGAQAIAQGLTQLTNLNITNNSIGETGAQAIAERLTQLTNLDITNNSIGETGAQAIAERLTQLTNLDITNNSIGETGAQAIAERLTQLTNLNITDNSIGETGAQAIAERLTQLTNLDIGSNENVTDLSPFADRIRAGWPVTRFGTGLSVNDCPLVTPPMEIVDQGSEAVRNYFMELAAGEDKLFEAKVLILGQGGAGKTSLLRRLYQPGMPLPKVDETTRGIDIHRHDFEGESGRDFRLNVWDFGGQQIYHATHQFFLTKNSLYVLVDDTKKDDQSVQDEGFKYWLEVVETLSSKCPVLIFQNEKGGRSKSIDEPGIMARFPNVQVVCGANLEHDDAAAELAKEIRHYVQRLRHVGETVPAKWVDIRKAVEERAKTEAYITQEDYFDIYRQYIDFDQKKALHLSDYLHDLGVFLHFQDDLLLKRTVILQNNWATEAVFKILDDEAVKARFGQFTEADCERLWQHSQYAAMHPQLLGLMEKFELCYRLQDQPQATWLSPQLLPPSVPDCMKDWGEPGDLALNHKYDFLPKGMVNRLMVRMHRFVQKIDMCWSYGALFEQGATELLVQRDARGNQILMRARGPEARELLSIISSDLDALNNKFEGLRVDKQVPCICDECKASIEPHLFSEADLRKRRAKGVEESECFVSYEKMSVAELLDGLKVDRPKWADEELTEDLEDGEPNMTTKTIKIFLASSAELADQRDQFELFALRQNTRLKSQAVELQVIRWETEIAAMSKTRKQDDYNDKVRECDLFVSLFRTKTGCFTEEEFDVALETFEAGEKPLIYTYFQNVQINIDDADSKDVKSRKAFQKKLGKRGHFYDSYDDINHLQNQFRDQLDKLLAEDKL